MHRSRVILLVAALVTVGLLTGARDILRDALTDLRFAVLSRPATGSIAVVAMDARSIEAIGVWPWSRRLHAALIGRLEQFGATDIVFDIDFSSRSAPAEDAAFAAALRQAEGSVVLPTFKQPTASHGYQGPDRVTMPLRQFRDIAWPAVVTVPVEADGRVRRYLYQDHMDGLTVPTVGAYLGGPTAGRDDAFWIDFGIAATTVPVISYIDVLANAETAAAQLAGKKVIIGGTAIELGDRFTVPNGRVIPGVLLQAIAGESILQGRALTMSGPVVATLGLLGLAGLVSLLWGRVSAPVLGGVLIGLSLALEAGALLVQATWPIIVDTALVQIALAGLLAALVMLELDLRGLLGRIADLRFQKVTMSLGDGLICTDQAGVITLCNPSAATLFGCAPDDLVGQPFAAVCPERRTATAIEPFALGELSPEAVHRAAREPIELVGRRRDGETFPIEGVLSAWQGTDGWQFGLVLRDVSVQRREAERIRYLAEHDTLTGLVNRQVLHARLADATAAALTSGRQVALLIIDLDKFKQVNDTLGHRHGDALLCAVANRLASFVAAPDFVARVSGDEFAVVLIGDTVAARADALMERIASSFAATPLLVCEREMRINVSVGGACAPADAASPEELLANADLALYRAKTAGRGCSVRFEPSFRAEFDQRLELEQGLARALLHEEFELFYQPQIDLATGALAGAEALIRWWHPRRGLLTPGAFMPIANASWVSDAISLWVLRRACRQAAAWSDAGHPIRIGVNLSPSQLLFGDLAATVADILATTGLSPSRLELEVTEDILIADDEAAARTFGQIRQLGVQIAFDDFGTGYGSLSYLKKFAPDRLKIDKSFVHELTIGTDDAAIVRSTIGLGKQLGLSVIAEGIEHADTVGLLRSMGCDEGQGYLFGAPMRAATFEQTFFGAPRIDAGRGGRADAA
ncbi:EAL domain-containing protein [Rhodoplanes serenus]|uniref:EAL domain-containing protein n=1 Tax=Rhodoplanes serenus TaxID=200615 RepID=UPI000DABAD84|nr:EAL domain-containing protein [Rhodoplanes serenus]RAI34308.1 hypothetical protein CH340_09505 [Rhodoplanes serenus]